MNKIKIESIKSINDIDVSIVRMDINRKYRNYPEHINIEHEIAVQNGKTVEEYFIRVLAKCFAEKSENAEDNTENREEIANYEILFFIQGDFKEKYLQELEREIKDKNNYICEILNAIIIVAYPKMESYLTFIASTLNIPTNLEIIDFIQTADVIQNGIME